MRLVDEMFLMLVPLAAVNVCDYASRPPVAVARRPCPNHHHHHHHRAAHQIHLQRVLVLLIEKMS